MKVEITRHDISIIPAHDRVLIQPFIPKDKTRTAAIISRVLSLPESEVTRILRNVRSEFSDRHFDIELIFRHHFERVREQLGETKITQARKLLIGSYFTSEYSLESAALFNPSIVVHPNQSGIPKGSVRFVMSLRATGEGHISSIEFRNGIIDESGQVSIDPPGRYVTKPRLVVDSIFDKPLFCRKLREIGDWTSLTEKVMDDLPEKFSRTQLVAQIARQENSLAEVDHEKEGTLNAMRWVAESNYEVAFRGEEPLSERIIFPVSSNESNGIEDARFVRFTDDEGDVTYYATYTAYDGRTILPQMLETKDFRHFHIRTLNGPAAQNKGMALFPRKINGHYMMIGRQDNQNLFLMSSDHPHFWFDAEKLLAPKFAWEFVQIGNCGSPVETEHGWILLTHGVGTMRKYCIGAVLLDREDPAKVIGRLPEPLLAPDENEREGYVPNVVYTCGAMIHGEDLIIPYAMSDYASTIASVKVHDLATAMKSAGP